MKSKRVFKTVHALPSDENAVAGKASPAPGATQPPPKSESIQEHGIAGALRNSEAFREMLLRRFTAPFIPRVPYRHWGINE
jgi:hypothetical protein